MRNGIQPAHRLGRYAELFHQSFVARARQAGAVEVTDEAQRHQHQQNPPANTRRRGRLAHAAAAAMTDVELCKYPNTRWSTKSQLTKLKRLPGRIA
jgi:hypothetical protein